MIVPDLLNVLCAFENGAEGVLEFSGVNVTDETDRVEIYGDKGTLVYDFGTDKIRAAKYGGKEFQDVDLPPELTSEWRVEEDFIAAVKSKGRIASASRF